MLKYELNKIFKKKLNKILLTAALILAVIFSIFAINGVRYVDENGTLHKGFSSARMLSLKKNVWKGYLTDDVLSNVVSKKQQVKAQYKDQMNIPDDVYGKEEESHIDIDEFINNILSKDDQHNSEAIYNLKKGDIHTLYDTRLKHIQTEIKEEGTTKEQQEYLNKLYQKIDTPFYYESPDSWSQASLLGQEYALVLVLLAGFLAAGVFSDEYKFKADSIFFSTKYGRTKAIHAKIRAGIIAATAVYFIGMLLFSLISFSAMGTSGFKTPIQIAWCYSIYKLTYGQWYMLIILCGYIACLFSAAITMLVSAKLKNVSVATAIPFILFCVMPFVGRALPFRKIAHLTPDQLMNVYNSIRFVLVYQIGKIVFTPITFIMILYAAAAVIILPMVYLVCHRYSLG